MSSTSQESDILSVEERYDEVGVLDDGGVAKKVISRVISGQHQDFTEVDLPMGGGKAFPPALPSSYDYRVEFTGPSDPILALNWEFLHKLRVCVPLVCSTLVLSWGSGIYAPIVPHVSHEFHVGEVVASLGISLYVLGFASGPIVWGPMSELYGRKPPMVLSYCMFACFTFASATAKDIQTLLICRFFAGSCGAAPFSVVAASFADMFPPKVRGITMTLYSLVLMGGPMISPIVGAYIANSSLSWRWTLYITGIMSTLAFAGIVFLQDESYGPSILQWKARELRRRTGIWGIHAEIETQELDFNAIVQKSLRRPLRMLVTEPILFWIAIYNGFVYGLLYMSLEAMPIIFTGYGFQGGNLYLPYLSIFIGCSLSAAVNILIFEPRFHRKLEQSDAPTIPEERLPFMMLGSICFAVGIFWLCWTGAYHEHIHWIVPCIGGAFYGFGFVALFIPVYNYLLDIYQQYAASALSAAAFVRGGMGCAFPLFTAAMFHKLGVQWAGTLIGCIAVILLPVPFAFYTFGKRIRSRSTFAGMILEHGAKKKQ